MIAGERLTLRIEKPVAGGRMLARAEGAVVLVAGALPGELVEARVERIRHGTVLAATERALEPSVHRVGEPDPCGGAVLAHAAYDLQLSIKQLIVQDAFARVGRQSIDLPPIVPSPLEGYRMRARLHAASGRVGFYREGSHVLCDAASTRQLLPETTTAIDALMDGLEGCARDVVAVDVSENREGSERGVHLELARDADASRIGSVTAVGITTLSVSHQHSPRVRVLTGEGYVTDRVGIADRQWSLSRSTRAFFQGNRYLLDTLIRHVVSALQPGPVTDLYAGVGLFAVAAAAAGHAPVMAVEGDAVSAADLRRNTAEWRGLVQARHASVEEYVRDRRLVRPQTLILDPPRTGLSRRALDGVVALRAPRVVYVSCDVPTLARDVRAMAEAGYRLSAITAFDLFPRTAHVEVVGVVEL